jgi:hypothetical protein
MATLPLSGRAAIANAISKRPIHIAWGSGDGAWLTPPAESSSATALIAELGRRVATQFFYVVPDEAGAISVASGRYSASPGNAPTRHLYVTVDFDYAEASSAVVREVAIFSDTVVQSGLPGGQAYFTPGQITDPGLMLYIENLVPIFRNPQTTENFSVVVTF